MQNECFLFLLHTREVPQDVRSLAFVLFIRVSWNAQSNHCAKRERHRHTRALTIDGVCHGLCTRPKRHEDVRGHISRIRSHDEITGSQYGRHDILSLENSFVRWRCK